MSKNRIRPQIAPRYLVEASYDFTGKGRTILCNLCYHKRMMAEAPKGWKQRGKALTEKHRFVGASRRNHVYRKPMLRVREKVKPYEKVHCMNCGYPQKRLR